MHKNQILFCVACCIKLKCSTLGELEDDQETKHDFMAGLTWCWAHTKLFRVCSIVIGRLRVVEMEDGWVWRHQQGHKAGTGLSECLGHTVSTTPAHFLQLHNTPRPGDNDLMIHRGGTEWTHWSLPDPKEYENTYWKPRHAERIVRDTKKA